MKIVVCIKQVPGTSQVEINPETGVLKRDGAAAKINPYDLYALETAMRLKERCGGNVTAVTMGPSQAEAMMKEAYMMGVDQDVTHYGLKGSATSVERIFPVEIRHGSHQHRNCGKDKGYRGRRCTGRCGTWREKSGRSCDAAGAGGCPWRTACNHTSAGRKRLE